MDGRISAGAGQQQEMAYRVQARLLVALALGYAAGTVHFTGSWLLALAGILIAALAAGIGKSMDSSSATKFEPMAIWGIGGFGLFSLGLKVQFPMELGWTAMLALNVFLTLGAWAIHRLPSGMASRPSPRSVLSAVGIGVVTALGVSVVAGVVILIGATAGSHDVIVSGRGVALMVGSYLVAGFFGGILVGILRPFAAWPVGRMLIGIVVVALIYSVVGIAMYWMGDPQGPQGFRDALLMGLGIGLFGGPMGALAWTVESR